MLPISCSADWPISSRQSQPSIPHSAEAASPGKTRRMAAGTSPTTGVRTAKTSCSSGPTRSAASAMGTKSTAGGSMSVGRPTIWDRAVAALPVPMLPSSWMALI